MAIETVAQHVHQAQVERIAMLEAQLADAKEAIRIWQLPPNHAVKLHDALREEYAKVIAEKDARIEHLLAELHRADKRIVELLKLN